MIHPDLTVNAVI